MRGEVTRTEPRHRFRPRTAGIRKKARRYFRFGARASGAISTGKPSPHPYLRSAIACTSSHRFAIHLMVEHTGGRRNLMAPYPHADARIAPDVLDPTGGLAVLAKKVQLLAASDKPNLDFARQSADASDRGQMEHLLIGEGLKVELHHHRSGRGYPRVVAGQTLEPPCPEPAHEIMNLALPTPR